MGQSSSRISEQPPQSALTADTNQSSVAGVSSDLQPDSAPDHEGVASNHPQSRRSSLRKSILKLVKPTSIRNRVHNDIQSPGDVRRSWRNSRRWSRAPHTTTLQEESVTLQGSPSESSTAGPSISSPSSLAKGKQREIIEELDDPASPATLDETLQLSYPSYVLDSELPSTSTQSSAVMADSTVTVPQNIDNPSPEDLYTESGCDSTSPCPAPVEELNDPLPSELTQTPLHQPQQQPNTLQRQFPPPGTLVVVQGIVHTTDMSRSDNNTSRATGNSDNPPPIDIPSDQTPSRPRNRLSALLRPRSTSRPVSAIINEPISTASAGSQTDGGLDSSSGSQLTLEQVIPIATVPPSSEEPTNPALHDNPSQSSQQSQPVMDNHTPAISSSSIDVLGTLLSVAAAATAASLLTGSSEPILSSGLAPPHPNTHSSRVPHSHSPSHNASMADLPPYDLPHPNGGFPDASTGRTERMRQAWSTIRERLGLRSSTSPSDDDIGNSPPNTNHFDNPSASSSNDPVGLPSPTDTRELMLAEMARAFNIGLGLNGLGGLAPAANPTDANAAPSDTLDSGEPSPAVGQESASQSQPVPQNSQVTLPPEGSFERFLVDLQMDLRIALTRPEEDAVPEPTHYSPSQPTLQTDSQQSHSFNTDGALLLHQSTSSAALPSTLEQPLQSGSDVLNPPTPASPNPISEEDIEYADMPALQEHSDSETEFEDEDHEDDDYEDDFQSTEQRSVGDEGHQTFGNSQSLPTSSGTGRIDSAGRINWWRLYRFPPIVSPHLNATRDPMISTPASSTSNPPTSAATLDDIAAGLANPDVTSNLTVTDPLPTQSPSVNTPAEPSTHSVIPVIVVGLQSVNSEWRPDLPHQPGDEGLDLFGQPAPGEGMGDENGSHDDLDGWATQQHVGTGAGDAPLDGARGRGRARGWQSRAADAIRNLRPGRRNAEANPSTQLPTVTPGSRTFLIYVIGGYYPPDHNIVTGGANILDSFEALLELADLLGQVKPPTASKDDIEKSGLEIIKAFDLPEHEKDGKVSSNCTDRCLICLDDYEPEDPIRVMSCRHAFHKTCVDEWLLRGRNNCPACRSTGVSTDNHSTTPLPPTMMS